MSIRIKCLDPGARFFERRPAVPGIFERRCSHPGDVEGRQPRNEIGEVTLALLAVLGHGTQHKVGRQTLGIDGANPFRGLVEIRPH